MKRVRFTTMTWRQIVPTLITLAAMMCGFFSILVTLESMGRGNEGQYHRWAAQLIMLAMILDGIDGNVARRLKGCSQMGSELDTYVDMTAFGIAPAVLIYVVSLQGGQIEWRVLMTSAVVLSGVLRLARFKAKDPLRGQSGFSGLPITACAAWVALLVFISESEPLDRFSLKHGPMAVFFLFGIALFAGLQVSNVHYPKPTKHLGMFLPMVVAVSLLFIPHARFAVTAAFAMIFLGLGYVFFGPVYMKWQTVRRRAATPRNGGAAGHAS